MLALAYLCMGALSVPAAAGVLLGVYWVLASPVSLLLGVLVYKRFEGAHAQ